LRRGSPDPPSRIPLRWARLEPLARIMGYVSNPCRRNCQARSWTSPGRSEIHQNHPSSRGAWTRCIGHDAENQESGAQSPASRKSTLPEGPYVRSCTRLCLCPLTPGDHVIAVFCCLPVDGYPEFVVKAQRGKGARNVVSFSPFASPWGSSERLPCQGCNPSLRGPHLRGSAVNRSQPGSQQSAGILGSLRCRLWSREQVADLRNCVSATENNQSRVSSSSGEREP
jgi:hypothetical protein